MTERRQTKFKEKIYNQNYVIYIGICSLAIVVLYVYRFHFATITISYALGCLACYFTLNSYIFNNYLEQFKRNFVKNSLENGFENVLSKGCVTCGSKDCNRHDSGATSEPWTGLQVHKQLDQAIEEFYNTILDQFICSWYNKITPQPFFVDELRHQLRYASACLLGRAVKINYSRFITERLLPCALRHYTLCAELSDTSPLLDSKMAVHPAAANRNAELKYLRCVTNAIVPYLLRHGDVESSVFRVLIREIFAGWVLLALTDVLADPYILNTLIVLATGDEKMAELPTTPDYGVEFLETFARQSDTVYTARSKMFKLDLDMVLNDQDYFYAFMQFLKTTSHIHLLQFYKDIKSFQTKLLNPELAPNEEESLINEAWDIYSTYFDSASPSCVHLDQSLAIEMKSLLKNSEECIKRLQTSRALYQAARQSHAALDKVMLPRFLHSEQFYNLLIGSRVPTGYQKQLTKKQQDKLILQALKIGNKLKGALKPQILDGQVLDNINSDSSDSENVDIDILKYLDSDSKRDQDLSTCKVVITHIETRIQAPPRRGTVRYFTIAVHRVEKRASASFWSVERSEHDFHLLRSKLIEFHADKLLQDLPLPSRRDNSPMETLRYKYEDFLQRLLQKSLLQTSELLHLFLTVEGDFSPVVQASSLTANSTDFTNIYQSVTHKLRKEKGQHLECFLKSFLVSSDVERFQAAKQPIPVEEAIEVNEDAPTHHRECPRDIMSSCFGDNFGVEPAVAARDWRHQNKVVGFTQCVVYMLKKVLKAPAVITGLIGSVLTLTRDVIDDVTNSLLDSALRKLLNERTLAHLIRLGQEQIFGKKAGLPREDSSIQRERAKRQLMASIPSPVTRLGTGIPEAVLTAFQIIQRPELNKQLVYNLLDLCLMELFPELDTARNETEEPKS